MGRKESNQSISQLVIFRAFFSIIKNLALQFFAWVTQSDSLLHSHMN